MENMRVVLRLGLVSLFVGLLSAAAEARIDPSESCGQCHKTIYETWKTSGHASSMEGDPFLRAFRETEASGGKALARVCVQCHAPLAAVTGDHDLEYRVTWEGVNCETCHSLVSVRLTGDGPKAELRPGSVKRGPFDDAPDTAHGVAYSELHTSALACAWCHEYVNPEGTPILTTYTEWSGSRAAAEGQACQACHMDLAHTGASDPRADRLPGAPINLHAVPGGHSLEQLNKALGVTIDSRREPDQLSLDIHLTNKGAGHAVPTGMPGRRVILDLVVRAGDRRFEERKVYGKFFVSAEGRPLNRDRDYFTGGVRLDLDSRIKPDERRTEAFRFPIPGSETAYVSVRLHYEHSPLGSEEHRTWLTFLSEKRTLIHE